MIDPGHPYIKHIYSGGDFLMGGEVREAEPAPPHSPLLGLDLV